MSIRLVVNPETVDATVVDTARDVILRGGVLLYPTDTTYALGVNALDLTAIKRLYELKNRPANKPFHVVTANLKAAERYVLLNDIAFLLAERYLPGPLTLVLPRKETVPAALVAGLETLGIRIPNNSFCSALAGKLDIPFTTTSANLSGEEARYDIDDILHQFDRAIDHIDLVVDQGPLEYMLPSTVLDLSIWPPRVVREGSIAREELELFLSQFEVNDKKC